MALLIQKSDPESIALLKQLTENMPGGAKALEGIALQYGIGVRRDEIAALKLFQQASLGNACRLLQLAQGLHLEHGVSAQEQARCAWVRANLGDLAAALELANLVLVHGLDANPKAYARRLLGQIIARGTKRKADVDQEPYARSSDDFWESSDAVIIAQEANLLARAFKLGPEFIEPALR
jgi:hypothetical protein